MTFSFDELENRDMLVYAPFCADTRYLSKDFRSMNFGTPLASALSSRFMNPNIKGINTSERYSSFRLRDERMSELTNLQNKLKSPSTGRVSETERGRKRERKR